MNTLALEAQIAEFRKLERQDPGFPWMQHVQRAIEDRAQSLQQKAIRLHNIKAMRLRETGASGGSC